MFTPAELCPKSTGRLLTDAQVYEETRAGKASQHYKFPKLLRCLFLMSLAKNQINSKINSHVSEIGTISRGFGGIVLVVYITIELEGPAVSIRIVWFYRHLQWNENDAREDNELMIHTFYL